ncbi:MAG: hypothetical protein ACK5IC_07035 [Moheibacter sp.]
MSAKIVIIEQEYSMNKKYLKIVTVLVILFTLGLSVSCSDDDGQKDCNPAYAISVSINIGLPLYSELETRGWTYVGGAGTGSRGIIVVKTNSGYKAYDRNAPHICPTVNSTLEVIEDIKLYCPEDEAEWILLTGQPLKGADRAPRTYTAQRVGDIVNIYN